MQTATLTSKPVSVALGILVSRLLAFTRDLLLAYWLGASFRLDAFLIAFKIPNLARRLFNEGVLAQVILPQLAPLRAQPTLLRAALWRALRQIFWRGLVLVIIAELLSRWIIITIAPGFTQHPQTWLLATQLLRLMLPVLWFISLTGVCTTALSLLGAYTTIAIAPGLLNVILVLMLLVWVPHLTAPLPWVALSLSLGGFMQLLLQIPALMRHQLWFCRSDNQPLPARQSQLPHAGMRLLALSSAPLGIIIIMAMSSYLPAGSISCIYFIDRLTAFPLALIGAVLAFVAIPLWHQQRDDVLAPAIGEHVAWILRLSIPATLGLWFLSDKIVTILFNGAHFSLLDGDILSRGLQVTALAITPWLLLKLLVSLDFSQGRGKRAGYSALIALTFTLIAGIYAAIHWGILGLLTSLTIAAYLNLLILIWPQLRCLEGARIVWLGRCLLPIMTGCLLMYGVLRYMSSYLSQLNVTLSLSLKLIALAKLLGVIIIAMGVYGVVWWVSYYASNRHPREGRGLVKRQGKCKKIRA